MSIDLNFNEQQQLIQNTAREFFQKHCPIDVVRRAEKADEEYPADLWRGMADLGWLGITFPEAYGGLGCSFLDLYALYGELGRSLAPVPHLECVALAGTLVAELGSETQKAEWLPRIAAGEAILTPALMEPDGLYGPDGVTLSARRDGDSFLLNGVKLLVAYAKSADRLVCAARIGAGDGAAGVSLFLVDPKAPGVSLEKTTNMASAPLYAVIFKDVAVPTSDALGEVGGAWPVLDATVMKAAVLQSAMVVGAGEVVLDMTADYARTRVQFGQPIGRHQAVQYLVTDIAIEQNLTRNLALRAAWRIESGRSFLREAALAKACASKAAAAMTFAAHEVHAGIGFMLDYDLQLYTLRAKHWESNLGDRRHCLERAMAEGGDDPLPHFQHA